MRLYILLLLTVYINTNIYSQIKPKITTNQISNLLVDSTRLENDSILVYYQNGIVIGRDTISGTGGSVGGVTGSGTTNEIAYFTGATTLGSLATSTYPSLTELSYVKGVTSAIQTQLNGKQATLTNPVTGTGNSIFIGVSAGQNDDGTTNQNVGIGYSSMALNTTGSNNTALGYVSLYNLNGGTKNIAIGANAGRFRGSSTGNLTSADNSIFIGVESRASDNGNSNEIVIGNEVIGNGSNSVTIGNNGTLGTATSKIILNGNVGIGQTSPTAVLHLKAGTASANTAPLKFTSGTKLTTPEVGAMEFEVDSLFFTTTNLGRKQLAYTDNSNVDVLSVSKGGTGATTLTSGAFLKGNGTSAVSGSNNLTETADTVFISKFLNVDTSTLYVDAVNNRVGIGTSSPANTLHVQGKLLVDATSMPSSASMHLGQWTGIPNSISDHSSIKGDLFVGNVGANTPRLRVTSNAVAGFISMNDYYDPLLFYSKNLDSTKSSYIINLVTIGASSNTDYFEISRSYTGTSTLNYSSLFTITGAGNVGIGTTSPAHKLTVGNGTGGAAIYAHGNLVSGSALRLGPNASSILQHYGEGFNPNAVNEVISIGSGDANTYLVFNSGGSEKIRVLLDGKVGIGTTSPGYLLEVNGSAAKPGGGDWTNSSSDKRLKKNIRNYTNGLDILMQINPVYYQYNGLANLPTDKEYVGIIAQDILPILPETITYRNVKLNETDNKETQVYGFDGSNLKWIMINAIQEQQAIIETQQTEIETLKSQYNDLLQRIINLENK